MGQSQVHLLRCVRLHSQPNEIHHQENQTTQIVSLPLLIYRLETAAMYQAHHHELCLELILKITFNNHHKLQALHIGNQYLEVHQDHHHAYHYLRWHRHQLALCPKVPLYFMILLHH